jgi:ribonuclease D
VLHAAGQDLPSLAELGLHPASLFDTELAARLLGMERVGLGAVVEDTLGLRLAKEHSAADWSKRPLPESWLVYAALDVEVLVQVRDVLQERLETAGKAEWAQQEFAHEVAREHGPTRSRRAGGACTASARCAPRSSSPRPGRCGPGATSWRARRISPRTA